MREKLGRSTAAITKFCALAMAAIALASCAATVPTVRPNPSNPTRTVAVLPLYNATNDVDGPSKVRELVIARLHGLQYQAPDAKTVDTVLADKFGISLGSQLELATPEKLGTELGTDALLYGYLLNYDTLTTVIYNSNKVRAAFRLVDAKTGRTIWMGAKGVKSVVTAGGRGEGGAAVEAAGELVDQDSADFTKIPGLSGIPGLKDWHKLASLHEKSGKDAAIIALGGQLVTSAFRVQLRLETDEMLNRVFSGFPAGPGK